MMDSPAEITEKKTALRNYITIWFICFLQFAGYGAVLVLQSSINIERGTGVWSLMATYVGGSLFNLFFTPTMIRKLGARKTLLISQATYLCYIIANFFPEPYILIPAGALVGIGEACFWPTAILFVMHFAKVYAGRKPAASFVTQFLGLIFSGLSLSAILGNILSWAILYGGKTKSSDDIYSNTTVDRDVSMCGKNDCQNPNITELTIEQYEPDNMFTFYFTIGAMCTFVMISFLISLFSLPEIDPRREYSPVSDKPMSEKPKVNDNEKRDNPGFQEFSTCSTIKGTLCHLVTLKQLLLTPYALYCGLHLAFGFSEITRAYVSCLKGVDQVGLFILTASIFNGITSPIVAGVSAKYGRNIPMTIGYFLDVGQYIFLLYWVPTLDNSWIVFFIAAVYGMVDGVMQLSAQDLHGSFFPKKREFALSAVNMYNTLGWGILYAVSTTLCVETKIYIMIGWTTLAIICYGLANIIYRDELRHVAAKKLGVKQEKNESSENMDLI